MMSIRRPPAGETLPGLLVLILAAWGLPGPLAATTGSPTPKPPRTARPVARPKAAPVPTPDPAPVAAPPVDPGAALVRSAGRYNDILRDALPVLSNPADTATLRAVLADGRRAAAEIDRLSANAAIFQLADRDRQALQNLAAEAHLHLALFETHGLEFDRARQELARARALSDRLQDPDLRTEWLALQEGGPGQGLRTRYQLLTISEFEAALQGLWSRARVVPFEAVGFEAAALQSIDLTRVPAADPGTFDDLLVSRGAAALREALQQGKRQIEIPLPAGAYRLRGGANVDLDRMFLVPELSDVDPIVIDRDRFSLALLPKPGANGPRFFLNGIEATDLSTMAYGVYRVKADPGTYPAAPEALRFAVGEGSPEKSREIWTIYVPAGSLFTLPLDKASLSQRLFHR